MIFSPVRFCRKQTYLTEDRLLAPKSESGGKSANLGPNGVLQFPQDIRMARIKNPFKDFLSWPS